MTKNQKYEIASVIIILTAILVGGLVIFNETLTGKATGDPNQGYFVTPPKEGAIEHYDNHSNITIAIPTKAGTDPSNTVKEIKLNYFQGDSTTPLKTIIIQNPSPAFKPNITIQQFNDQGKDWTIVSSLTLTTAGAAIFSNSYIQPIDYYSVPSGVIKISAEVTLLNTFTGAKKVYKIPKVTYTITD